MDQQDNRRNKGTYGKILGIYGGNIWFKPPQILLEHPAFGHCEAFDAALAAVLQPPTAEPCTAQFGVRLGAFDGRFLHGAIDLIDLSISLYLNKNKHFRVALSFSLSLSLSFSLSASLYSHLLCLSIRVYSFLSPSLHLTLHLSCFLPLSLSLSLSLSVSRSLSVCLTLNGKKKALSSVSRHSWMAGSLEQLCVSWRKGRATSRL